MLAVTAFAADLNERGPVMITVVSSNDFHGYLEPTKPELTGRKPAGGAEFIATYIRKIRDQNPDGFLLLDAGDFMSGSLISNYTRGKAVVDFYNLIGYDAATIGNHEFDFGPRQAGGDPTGVLKDRLAEASFPILAANIFDRKTGKRLLSPNLKPFRVVERKGVRIGIIGLSTLLTPLTTLPNNIRNLEFRPAAEEVKKIVPLLRKRGVKMIIVLAHMGGVCETECEGEIANLAKSLDPSDIDLIVSGHSHTKIAQRINGIPVVQAYSKGVALSHVDLYADASSGTPMKDQTKIHQPIIVYDDPPEGSEFRRSPYSQDDEFKPDPKTRSLMELYRSMVSKIKDQFVCTNSDPLFRKVHGESPIGILVTDAMRSYFPGTQVAMYNSGGIRSDLPAGKINYGNIFEVIPFDNTLVRLKLTGDQLREILDWGASRSFGLMAISGIEATLDMAQPAGQKVKLVTIGGKPVDPYALYDAVTNDFLLAGGDGYSTFAKGKDITNTYLLIRDIFEGYLRRLGSVSPPPRGNYTLLNWPFSIQESP
jgi:2',3'-cyclic-nucleotide 2'-phosphodiesterase (5'-nucleotidase family)